MNDQRQNGGHDPFSPSAYAGWMNCAAYMQRNRGRADAPGEAAKFGTHCHDVFATWINTGEMSDNSEEVQEAIAPAVSRVLLLRAQKYEVRSEVHSDAGKAFPKIGADICGGTADIVAFCKRTRTLEIGDLKTGHIFVPAESPQLKIYALGELAAWEGQPPLKVVTTVMQYQSDEQVRIHEYTPDELFDWGRKKMQPAIVAGCADDPVATPSEEACQWCRADDCPERAQVMFNTIPAGKEIEKGTTVSIKNIDIPKLDTNQLIQVFNQQKLIKGVVDGCKAELHARLLAGEKSDEVMLTPGRRSTQWTVGDMQVEDVLRKKMRLPIRDAYVMKLKSPAQVRKMKLTKFARKRLESMMETTRGGPTIVKRTDKKEEYISEMFAPIDTTETVEAVEAETLNIEDFL